MGYGTLHLFVYTCKLKVIHLGTKQHLVNHYLCNLNNVLVCLFVQPVTPCSEIVCMMFFSRFVVYDNIFGVTEH